MNSLLQGLRAVPLWLWIFLILTQVLTFADRCFSLPRLSRQIEHLKSQNWTDYPEESRESHRQMIESFEAFRRSHRSDLIISALLAPAFAGMAYWKWRQNRFGKIAPQT
jgi:hypothetical protein